MAKNKHRGSNLDDFLAREGVLEQFQAKAIRQVVAWQRAEAIRESKRSSARPRRCARRRYARALKLST